MAQPYQLRVQQANAELSEVQEKLETMNLDIEKGDFDLEAVQ